MIQQVPHGLWQPGGSELQAPQAQLPSYPEAQSSAAVLRVTVFLLRQSGLWLEGQLVSWR